MAKKVYTQEQLEARLEAERKRLQASFNKDYENYIDNGGVYLKTFNMSVDMSKIETPSPNIFEWIYEQLANTFALILGASAIFVGVVVGEKAIINLFNRIKKLIESLTDLTHLGIVLMVISLFTIGLRALTNNRSTDGDAKVFMSRFSGTGKVVGSVASEIIKGVRQQEFSLMALIKKAVLSILSAFDLAVQTVRGVVEGIMDDIIIQISVVIFFCGLACTVSGIRDKKTIADVRGGKK